MSKWRYKEMKLVKQKEANLILKRIKTKNQRQEKRGPAVLSKEELHPRGPEKSIILRNVTIRTVNKQRRLQKK